jgi:hypothetical protein
MNGQLNDRARRPGQVRNDGKRPGAPSQSCQYTLLKKNVANILKLNPLLE